MTTTWKKELSKAFQENGDSWDNVEHNTMSEEEMDKEFDPCYGFKKGIPFTVWTKDYVYFPVFYDGDEWVGKVSRNPDGKATPHQGGG